MVAILAMEVAASPISVAAITLSRVGADVFGILTAPPCANGRVRI